MRRLEAFVRLLEEFLYLLQTCLGLGDRGGRGQDDEVADAHPARRGVEEQVRLLVKARGLGRVYDDGASARGERDRGGVGRLEDLWRRARIQGLLWSAKPLGTVSEVVALATTATCPVAAVAGSGR